MGNGVVAPSSPAAGPGASPLGLDEADPDEAAQPIVQDRDHLAQHLVRLAAAVEHPLHRLQRPRVRAHASRSSPSNARMRSRYSGGISQARRSSQVDEDERLRRRHHQRVVLHPVGGAIVGDARPADPSGAHEDLEQVVEPRRRVVLDVRRSHHEVAALEAVRRPAEVAVVLGAGVVEVGEVAAVVDDPLRVGVREPHARDRRVLERRPAIGDPAELDLGHERISSSTSSRFASISSCERASRLRRSSGSVLDGRTLKCQSS